MQRPGTCPVCGSNDIDYDALEIIDCGAYYPALCNNCKTSFQEHYDLTFAGHYNVYDKNDQPVDIHN